jgi:hypothetical protein
VPVNIREHPNWQTTIYQQQQQQQQQNQLHQNNREERIQKGDNLNYGYTTDEGGDEEANGQQQEMAEEEEGQQGIVKKEETQSELEEYEAKLIATGRRYDSRPISRTYDGLSSFIPSTSIPSPFVKVMGVAVVQAAHTVLAHQYIAPIINMTTIHWH